MLPADLRKISVQYVKGVGPQRARLLGRLGIKTVYDLLYHFPRQYLDRSQLATPAQLVPSSVVTLLGVIVGWEEVKPRPSLTIYKAVLQIEGGYVQAVWYNQPHVRNSLPPGSQVLVTGRVENNYYRPQIAVVEWELYEGEGEVTPLLPLYPLTEKLTHRALRQMITSALAGYAGEVKDFLPDVVLKREGLIPLGNAWQLIHFPASEEEWQAARYRFIFEEFFLWQLIFVLHRQQLTRRRKPHYYRTGGSLLANFLSRLPFQLTAAQQRVWQEIESDLLSPYPMHRLLQGDVGSGKTVIALMSLLRAAESNLQGALMVPTEILAEQHYWQVVRYLHPLGVRVGILLGGQSRRERQRVLGSLAAGQLDVVVGTHALIQEGVSFNRLGLVVIDEQHRFGVRQRLSLQVKGHCPDVLVMTATPIPRTLALAFYGDLEISVLDEMPPNRRPVKTYLRTPADLPRIYQFVRSRLDQGEQAYIVCPAIEESEKMDLKAAVDLYQELQEGEFKGYRLGLLHGRMKSPEKENVINAFRRGEIQLLVSTTVIEVGVDVPMATVMIILDAERFGLAQLHQLRGRVGRGGLDAYCILIARQQSGVALARLRALVTTSDGFKLAEQDLALRGPGEFTGTRQSGLPEFKVGDLVRDVAVLQKARQSAEELLRELSAGDMKILWEEIAYRFPQAFENVAAG